MKLTPTSKSNNIATHCKSSVGRENPFRQGFNKPQSLAVFLRLSVMDSPILGNLFNIMMVLFGQSLGLVAPCRGILTPLNTVANTVRSISDGFTNQRQGITA